MYSTIKKLLNRKKQSLLQILFVELSFEFHVSYLQILHKSVIGISYLYSKKKYSKERKKSFRVSKM